MISKKSVAFLITFCKCSQNIGQNAIPVNENHPSILKIKDNLTEPSSFEFKVSKGAKIRNRYNQVPHLTQDTNGKPH